MRNSSITDNLKLFILRKLRIFHACTPMPALPCYYLISCYKPLCLFNSGELIRNHDYTVSLFTLVTFKRIMITAVLLSLSFSHFAPLCPITKHQRRCDFSFNICVATKRLLISFLFSIHNSGNCFLILQGKIVRNLH